MPLTSGDGAVDDEGWLVDYTCTSTCWVEAGEDNTNTIYANGYGTTVYFWADQTPSVGFMFYYLGPVAQSDISAGNWIVYKINQDPMTSSTWNVTISRPGGAVLYTAASTSNAMTPNTVIEGQELSGSNNAQAPLAFFSYSSVYNGSTKTLRSADGTVRADHPPNANWWSGNKPSQTSNGGLFFTDCC